MVPVDRSILLSSFSRRILGAGKEELLDYYLTQFTMGTIEVPLGEEGFREIAITLIIKAPATRFQVQTFWTASDGFLPNPGNDVVRFAC